MHINYFSVILFLFSGFSGFSQDIAVKKIYWHPSALLWNEYKFSVEFGKSPSRASEYSLFFQLPSENKTYSDEGIIAETRQSLPYLNPLRTSAGLAHTLKFYGKNRVNTYWGFETVLRYLWMHNKYIGHESGTSTKEWVEKLSLDQLAIGEMLTIGTAPGIDIGSNHRLVFDFYMGIGVNVGYKVEKIWDKVTGTSSINALNPGLNPKETNKGFVVYPLVKMGLKIGVQF